MTQDRLNDLYDRLSSRKFLLCLFMVLLSGAGWMTGNLSYAQFQTAALAAVGIYSGAEGLTDAAGALSKPSPTLVSSLADELERRNAERLHV